MTSRMTITEERDMFFAVHDPCDKGAYNVTPAQRQAYINCIEEAERIIETLLEHAAILLHCEDYCKLYYRVQFWKEQKENM